MSKTTKILVVDDEPDTVLLAKRLLELDGYQIIAAYDGEEALQKFHAEKPNVVILDVLLPLIDGFEVCRKIKSEDNTADTCVIMFTVKSHDSDREKGFQSGANYYVVKPFSGERLRALIQDILANR